MWWNFNAWLILTTQSWRNDEENIYPLHTYCGGARLCIRSSLLCEPVSLRVAIVTIGMRFVHTTGKTWYKVLYQHTMYVISLSNISIKTNFKQITRVEIRLINLYNTLGRLHFVHDVTLFVAVHSFAVLTLLTLTCFPRIPLIWRHDKIVRQRRSRVTSRHSFIITVWWYNILYQTGDFL